MVCSLEKVMAFPSWSVRTSGPSLRRTLLARAIGMWTPPIGVVLMIPEIRRLCIRHFCTHGGAKYSSASSRLRIGVGDFGNCWDTSKHKEVSHEQEVCSPAVG